MAEFEDARLHDLRHTFASQAVRRGVSLPIVALLLGHADVKMTQRYAHVGDRAVEAAAERIDAAVARLLAEEDEENTPERRHNVAKPIRASPPI